MMPKRSRLGRLSLYAYAECLSLLPRAFQDGYGPLLLQLFADQVHDAERSRGAWGVMRLWPAALADIAHSIVREHVTAWRGETMETTGPYLLLTRLHVAELVCGGLAAAASFGSFQFGALAFAATTALATVLGTLAATLIDRRWRRQAGLPQG